MADTRRSLSALQALFADNTAGDISAQDGRDGWQSAHPEKVTQSAAFASEPGTDPLTGDLFLPSDGVYLERYSGSAWVPWGPCYPFAKPVSGDYAWINQGGAAVDATYGGISLACASNGGAHNLRIRKKAAPSAPYTITAAFVLQQNYLETGIAYAGLCWRQSSDGKLITAHFLMENVASPSTPSAAFSVYKWTDPSTFSASYGTLNISPNQRAVVWLRLQDDNTNRKVLISLDGQNWFSQHSVGRTDFMTADEVGFFVNPYSIGCHLHLLSWKQA